MCKTESQSVTLTFDVTGHEELRILGSDAASNAEYFERGWWLYRQGKDCVTLKAEKSFNCLTLNIKAVYYYET
jgi:hypothetical protein